MEITLLQDVEIKAREEIEGLRLVFAYATGSLHGVVKFENGSPKGSVMARVYRNGSLVAGGRVDERGQFLLQQIPAGQCVLTVNTTDNGGTQTPRSVKQQVTVSDDKVSEVTLVLDLAPNTAPNPGP